jgi:pimeloyl-ACP methyl ester carboxylesterase
MPFIETQDHTSLFYNDWGTGQPMVFIHGWALGADMWEYQTTALATEGVRCIAYDKRGCGRSSQPWDGYDYDTFAADLAALLEQLDLRDVTVVAHSMAGGDVARYLSRHGADRIAGVALVATTLPFPMKTADNPEGIDKSVFDETVAALRANRPAFLAAGAPAFFGFEPSNGSMPPPITQWGVELFYRASPKATIDMVRTFSETDLRPELEAFTVPTLIVHGDADQSAPLEVTGKRVAEGVPGSRLEVYAGAPHAVFFTDKDRLNGDLLAFARSASG